MKQFDQMKNVLLNALHQPRRKSLSRVICHAALALLLPIQAAQGNELSAARCQYEQIKDGHPDGISKRYCGRQIARIMGWEGADWLERPERKTEEGLDQLIDRLQLKPGMQVGDIGAGTGRLSILMVDRIKPDGQVWAVDVQPEMVKYLVARAAKLGKNQLNVALSSETSPNIQAAKLDLAVMVDVYHELEFPREFLRNLMKSVKPGGQVVFVEYRANDRSVPIKPLHTMTIDQVKKEALDAGLLFERADSSLPWQHVVFFRTPTQLSK
jgi:SAM-dependent methyltransferase